MTRRAAFRQCDVVRAIKAAKVAGAARVIVRRDGALEIEVERRTDEEPAFSEPRVADDDQRDIGL